MKLEQTEVSTLEYIPIYYSRRRTYFRHNSLISTRYKEIQEDSQTQWFKRQPFPKEIQGENQPGFGEHFHVSHLNTNGADSSLKIPIAMENPWCSPKFPDNSLVFWKMRKFFKFPDNSLILLIAVNSEK